MYEYKTDDLVYDDNGHEARYCGPNPYGPGHIVTHLYEDPEGNEHLSDPELVMTIFPDVTPKLHPDIEKSKNVLKQVQEQVDHARRELVAIQCQRVELRANLRQHAENDASLGQMLDYLDGKITHWVDLGYNPRIIEFADQEPILELKIKPGALLPRLEVWFSDYTQNYLQAAKSFEEALDMIVQEAVRAKYNNGEPNLSFLSRAVDAYPQANWSQEQRDTAKKYKATQAAEKIAKFRKQIDTIAQEIQELKELT